MNANSVCSSSQVGFRYFPFPASRADRKSTRLNSNHSQISYAVFCLKKKTRTNRDPQLRKDIAFCVVKVDENTSAPDSLNASYKLTRSPLIEKNCNSKSPANTPSNSY